MKQLSFKKGLEKFGDKAEKAAIAELEQQHMRDSFKPVIPADLSPEQKDQILNSIMLLKEKRWNN